MKNTFTFSQLLKKADYPDYSKTNSKEDQGEAMEPSENIIQNILNFSKALAVFDTKISDQKGMMLMN